MNLNFLFGVLGVRLKRDRLLRNWFLIPVNRWFIFWTFALFITFIMVVLKVNKILYLLNLIDCILHMSLLLLLLQNLIAFFLSLNLGLVLKVFGKVTLLAHAFRIKKSVLVWTFRGIFISPNFSVTCRTHVFGVVFSIGMRTLCNCHHKWILNRWSLGLLFWTLFQIRGFFLRYIWLLWHELFLLCSWFKKGSSIISIWARILYFWWNLNLHNFIHITLNCGINCLLSFHLGLNKLLVDKILHQHVVNRWVRIRFLLQNRIYLHVHLILGNIQIILQIGH